MSSWIGKNFTRDAMGPQGSYAWVEEKYHPGYDLNPGGFTTFEAHDYGQQVIHVAR